MLQRPAPRLILASASASRRDLLRDAGLAFETCPAPIDEAGVKTAARLEGQGAEQTALRLAELKARHVAAQAPDALVIGADQILVCRDVWFDKPISVAAARAQLLSLRGQSHELVTAVLCIRGTTLLWHHVARPRLTMRQFSDAFLDAYLRAEGDAVTSTVGAYRLEKQGIQLFKRIEGDYTAILGLPALALLGFLREQDILVG